MRILFVHTIGKKKYGGGERWVVHAAGQLRQRGYTTFVAGKRDSILLNQSAKMGAITVPVNIISDISPYHVWKLARLIRKLQIDVVISKRHDLAVAGAAARISTKPAVIVRSSSPPRSSLKKHLFLISRLADGLITNTTTIRDIYKSQGLPDDGFMQVIYNGLPVYDDVQGYNFQDAYPGRTVILCVGRLVAAKGYFYLIDALERLSEKRSDILVYVLGEGKDKHKLQEYARRKGVEDMILFAGYRDQPVPWIKGCDLFLHPSLYEGMPNAPMEAMAYGKPVIMTKVNGADELSRNGRLAKLIPPADADAIVKAIEETINNPQSSRAMADNARQHVRSFFSMDAMVNNLEAFIIDRQQTKNRRQ
ncbi:MAG: glycosyltransferase [Bacteroidales bacterium]